MQLPGLLSLLIFLPIVAGLLTMVLASDEEGPGAAPHIALAVSVANALFSFVLLSGGTGLKDGTVQVASFEEHYKWIPSLGISYHLLSDGLSVFLIILVAAMTPFAVAASWKLIRERAHLYYGCMLMLSGGMVGVLSAADAFLFYVFFELMLIPAFFLVGLFGGARRGAATMKFVIYTMLGSLFMLVGLLTAAVLQHQASGTWSFDLQDLMGLNWPLGWEGLAFATFVLAFGIKAALFPFHTWLPETYGEAPAPVTFMLSALMSKMGVYGFLRIALPLCPAAFHHWAPVLVGLAVAGTLYAAFAALAQEDAKQVLAYASISHLGVVLLGVFAASSLATSGAVLHMVGHALTTGGLFLLVGFLAERYGTTQMSQLGGLTKTLPVFAFTFMVVMLASAGVPGLAGFVGEFLIFLGAFGPHATATALAALSIIFGAAYALWMFQRVMFGPAKEEHRAADMDLRERLIFAPLVVVILGVGLFPQGLLARITPAVEAQLQAVGKSPIDLSHGAKAKAAEATSEGTEAKAEAGHGEAH